MHSRHVGARQTTIPMPVASTVAQQASQTSGGQHRARVTHLCQPSGARGGCRNLSRVLHARPLLLVSIAIVGLQRRAGGMGEGRVSEFAGVCPVAVHPPMLIFPSDDLTFHSKTPFKNRGHQPTPLMIGFMMAGMSIRMDSVAITSTQK